MLAVESISNCFGSAGPLTFWVKRISSFSDSHYDPEGGCTRLHQFIRAKPFANSTQPLPALCS